MSKNILRILWPGKWILILFLVVFILFFAVGTTIGDDYNLKVLEIDSNHEIDADVSPVNLKFYDFVYLVSGTVAPVIGQFYLVYRFSLDSLWWGINFKELRYTFIDYVIILAKYYCILLSFDAGLQFSISLVKRKADHEDIVHSGTLVLYRSLIIFGIVLLIALITVIAA